MILWRAAADEILPPDSASFSIRRGDAEAYLDNLPYGGPNLYKSSVKIDPSRVLDLLDDPSPFETIRREVGLPHPGAIGIDEWIPRIAFELQSAGYDWIRVKESFPADSETWIWVGPFEREPELRLIARKTLTRSLRR